MSVLASRIDRLTPFGGSQVLLPALGFGAAPIGNLYQSMSDTEAGATVNAALLAGMNYLDTAPHYGFGLSERRLGQVLAQYPQPTIISTKVGRLLVPTDATDQVRHGFACAPALEPVFDYSYDGVMRSFEASLQRLQRTQVDILLAHDLGAMTHGDQHPQRFREFMDGGYRAMAELRESGMVKAIGMGANEWEICAQVLAHADVDGFLLAGRYSLLEQGACADFLPRCAERGVSIIIGGAFNSGILASGVRTAGPFYYNYEPAPAVVIAKVARLEAVCDQFHIPLAAAALQFPLGHPQVASVVAGLANPAQVTQACQWLRAPIPDEFWHQLQAEGLLHPDAPLPV